MAFRFAAFCYFLFLGLGSQSLSQPSDLSGPQIREIESEIQSLMADQGIPGMSVAISLDDQVVWSAGFGFADLENRVPATGNTIYRTASVGKAFTAVAMMQLVEQGAIDLDLPVQTYCPEFPEKRWPVTIYHLLTHQSGIRHYGGPNNDTEQYNTVHYDSVIDALEIFKNEPLQFEPGTAALYSTFGYNVLGCVIEHASEMRFLDYMRERVFLPAGMDATRDDDPRAIIANRAAGYVMEGGELRVSRQVDMSSKMPAGGYVTTAVELVKFAIAFQTDHLVAGATRERMLTHQKTSRGVATRFGIGWALGEIDDPFLGVQEVMFGGTTPQVRSLLWMLPERHISVAIFGNLENFKGRVGLAERIGEIVLGMQHGGPLSSE